jgi:hypothetical protein
MNTLSQMRAPLGVKRIAIGMDSSEIKIELRSIEAIARRVVELLRTEAEEQPARLTDAATLARELGVERDWIYSHANDLGAIRLGGPRGRLRFDREIVRERLEAGADSWPQNAKLGPHRGAKHKKSDHLSRGTRVKLPQTRRRASGSTPTQSPRPQHPGGSPE